MYTEQLIERWPALEQSLPSHFLFGLDADITIGAGSSLSPFSEIAVLKASTLNKIVGTLNIGDRTHIGSHANIRAAGGRIEIGNDVLIAQMVSLIASNHGMSVDAPYQTQMWNTDCVDVCIQDNVWIGAGCVVLPGVTIHEGAVVAAGAVVTKSIPVFELWGGVPAKCLRRLKDSAKSS